MTRDAGEAPHLIPEGADGSGDAIHKSTTIATVVEGGAGVKGKEANSAAVAAEEQEKKAKETTAQSDEADQFVESSCVDAQDRWRRCRSAACLSRTTG